MISRSTRARLFIRAVILSSPLASASSSISLGNATGGIRSPWVDVPTSKLSGLGQPAGGFAFLFGTTEPFDADKLAKLYPGGKDEYLSKFEKALDEAIAARNILAADRAEILALAAELY